MASGKVDVSQVRIPMDKSTSPTGKRNAGLMAEAETAGRFRFTSDIDPWPGPPVVFRRYRTPPHFRIGSKPANIRGFALQGTKPLDDTSPDH